MEDEKILQTEEEVTEQEPTSSEPSTPENLVENSAENTEDIIISLKNIDIFQKKMLILSKVNLTVKKGEFVYLIGKTGSGKSSILKVLFADVPAKGEEATCVGYDLKTIKTKQIPYLRRKLGIVFQDYQLLNNKSVADNLSFAMKATGWKDRAEMDARVEEVLKLVHLETKGHKFPYELSGGEQQRVCIARALINKPEVILADEPTGSLDPITAEEIFKIMHDINQTGTTVLMATHNFTMINKFSSRFICIEDGKIIDSLV